tara:strand:+ start:285350 stop:288730 length:3381 start_codon:yes stop_codon:yes gene_type:complete
VADLEALRASLQQHRDLGLITYGVDSSDSFADTEFVTQQDLLDGDFIESARAATIANLTLSGPQTVDGVALTPGDRVLVKDQASPAENGVYIVAEGSWTRSSNTLSAGTLLGVNEGTTQADTVWKVTTDGEIVSGTTATDFSQVTGGGGGGGGAVSSVFSRTGAVVATAGDYDASEVTFAPDGDIAATTVQAAIAEVRDDTDTKLTAKVTGPAGASDNALARYDGATGRLVQNSVVLVGDTGAVTGVASVDLDLAAAPAHTEGRLFYDQDEHCLAIYNDQAAVTHQPGQEGLIRVYNGTGSPIADGTPVYIAGVQLEAGIARPSVGLAQANAVTTARVIGLTTQTIASGSYGYVTSWGHINDLDLSAFSSGDELWLSDSTPGTYINTPPAVGNYVVQLGWVTNASLTGRLLVSLNAELSEQEGVAASAPTGVLNGGALSINANPAQFDVTAGSGVIVDAVTDPEHATITRVTWSASSANAVTNLATTAFTWVGVNSAGTLIQISDRAPTPIEARTTIWLGRLGHPNNTAILGVANRPFTAVQTSLGILDIARSLGPFNVSGNVYSANGANLNIDRSAGTTFLYGSNFQTDSRQPHQIDFLTDIAVDLAYRYRNGSGGWISGATRTTIDPGQWDNGSGVLQSVSPAGNRWTIQRIQFSTIDATVIYYGQVQYNSREAALAAIEDATEVDPALEETITRGWLVVRGDATNLSDPTQATFVSAGNGPGSAQVAGTVTGVTDHGALEASSLLDDDHPQYLLADGSRSLSGDLDAGGNEIQNASNLLNLYRGVRGFTTGNYLERAAGSALNGNATAFEFMVAVLADSLEGASGLRELVSCTEQFIGPGYSAGLDGVRPKLLCTDGGGTRFENFTGFWHRNSGGKLLTILHGGYDGTTRFLYLNGVLFYSASQTGYSVGTRPFRLGANAGATPNSPASGLTFLGFAFKSNGALTSTQREESIRTFLTTRTFSGSLFTSGYSGASLAPGAMPASWADEIGSLDLTLVGSLTVVDDAAAGVALTQFPGPDSIATVSGNALVRPFQTVAVAGPTTVSSGVVFCDTAAATIALTLPSFPASGTEYFIVDNAGNAAVNNITVNRAGSQLINGATTATVASNYGSLSLIYDGTNWTIL